jgi:hypothetical protein
MLLALSVSSIQSQSRKIKKMENRLEKLEEKIDKLGVE